MKKLFSFFAILGIILASNCSKITENNDPVIGIWSKVKASLSTDAKNTSEKQEWIFNDAYLGRYHKYDNGKIDVETDFKWEEEDGVYTISYPGISDRQNDVVTMIKSENGTILRESNGQTLATRE